MQGRALHRVSALPAVPRRIRPRAVAYSAAIRESAPAQSGACQRHGRVRQSTGQCSPSPQRCAHIRSVTARRASPGSRSAARQAAQSPGHPPRSSSSTTWVVADAADLRNATRARSAPSHSSADPGRRQTMVEASIPSATLIVSNARPPGLGDASIRTELITRGPADALPSDQRVSHALWRARRPRGKGNSEAAEESEPQSGSRSAVAVHALYRALVPPPF